MSTTIPTNSESNFEELVNNVQTARNQVDRHFAYMALQEYFYEKRDKSVENLQACIEWCLKDISELNKLDLDYHQQLQDEKKRSIAMLGKKGFNKWHNADSYDCAKFDCQIPAFKKLAIIYEQAKDYNNAISIVKQAEEYYKSHNSKWLPEVQKRLARLQQKAGVAK